VGVILSGRRLPEFSGLETFIFYLIHASSYVATSLSLIMWSISYRGYWSSMFAFKLPLITHMLLTLMSISLGSGWLSITLPAVLLGSLAFSTLVVYLSWQDWNSIEFG